MRTGLVVAPDGFVWWELTVTDRGRELSPAAPRAHLREVLPRRRRARLGQAGGAGLGLAIAREIARAHGGDIYATSDAGLTSFTVWIPQGPSVGKRGAPCPSSNPTSPDTRPRPCAPSSACCLPESGRTFEPEGRHAHLLDVEAAYEAFWCLVEDGAEVVVGCVGVRALSEDVCELKTLFVYERLQGQGWGRRLAEQAIGLARSRGFRAMRLDTISTSANAIGLYRRLGFRDIDRYDDNP